MPLCRELAHGALFQKAYVCEHSQAPFAGQPHNWTSIIFQNHQAAQTLSQAA